MDHEGRAPIPEELRLELQGLRAEINGQNNHIYVTTWIIVALMWASWLMSHRPGMRNMVLAMPAFGTGWAWAMARSDFLIHRLGAFLRSYSIWETSPQRQRKKALLLLLDLLSMTPILFLQYMGLAATFRLGEFAYGMAMLLLFAIGVGMIACIPGLFK